MNNKTVAIGTYADGRVVAWEVGACPPVVVDQGHSLLSVWGHVQDQGYRVVLVLDELDGDKGVSVLILRETDVAVGAMGAVGGDRRSDTDQ